jgi:hypothetical protein
MESIIICPECGHSRAETLPVDSSVYSYECTACHIVMRPEPGECCVFCSYGTVPCPFKRVFSDQRLLHFGT